MAYDETLAARVESFLVTKKIRRESKHMIGGLCLMVNGRISDGSDKNRLMARIGPNAYDAALKRKGCVPMDFTGKPMRGFVFVNPEGLASENDFRHWIDLALAYNPAAPKSGAKKRHEKQRSRD